jgi:hypothetical protein
MVLTQQLGCFSFRCSEPILAVANVSGARHSVHVKSLSGGARACHLPVALRQVGRAGFLRSMALSSNLGRQSSMQVRNP